MSSLIPYRRSSSLLPYDFESFFADPFSIFDTRRVNLFKTDIRETEDAYLMECDIPGVSPDAIGLEVDDNVLTITVRNEENKEEKRENYIRRERSFGTVQRSFALDNVKTDDITAKYENGVLKVTLPKEKPTKAARRKIDIH